MLATVLRHYDAVFTYNKAHSALNFPSCIHPQALRQDSCEENRPDGYRDLVNLDDGLTEVLAMASLVVLNCV